jgi:hypothetical protein
MAFGWINDRFARLAPVNSCESFIASQPPSAPTGRAEQSPTTSTESGTDTAETQSAQTGEGQ